MVFVKSDKIVNFSEIKRLFRKLHSKYSLFYHFGREGDDSPLISSHPWVMQALLRDIIVKPMKDCVKQLREITENFNKFHFILSGFELWFDFFDRAGRFQNPDDNSDIEFYPYIRKRDGDIWYEVCYDKDKLLELLEEALMQIYYNPEDGESEEHKIEISKYLSGDLNNHPGDAE